MGEGGRVTGTFACEPPPPFSTSTHHLLSTVLVTSQKTVSSKTIPILCLNQCVSAIFPMRLLSLHFRWKWALGRTGLGIRTPSMLESDPIHPSFPPQIPFPVIFLPFHSLSERSQLQEIIQT